MTRVALFTATAGYCGYSPIAPGTMGSVVGLLLHGVLRWTQAPLAEPIAILILFAAGVWASTTAERHFGGVDPGPVVIDEVVGMLMTLAFVPVGPSGALAGFLLFRAFDVIKPFPAGRLEKLHGGVGVMADDAMAAVYANLCLRLLRIVFPEWIA